MYTLEAVDKSLDPKIKFPANVTAFFLNIMGAHLTQMSSNFAEWIGILSCKRQKMFALEIYCFFCMEKPKF